MPLVGPDGVTPLSAPQTAPPAPDPDEPPMPRRVATAFLVVVEPNGRVTVTDDLAAPIVPSRKPSFDDILGAASNVVAEITARKAADMAAKQTVLTQLATARQMQSQTLSPAEQAAVAASQGRVPR